MAGFLFRLENYSTQIIPNDTLNIFKYTTLTERSERQNIYNNLKKVYNMDGVSYMIKFNIRNMLNDMENYNIQGSERRNIKDNIETYIVDYVDIYLNEHFRNYRSEMKWKLKKMFLNNFRLLAQENGLNRIMANIRRPEQPRDIEQHTVDMRRDVIDPILDARRQWNAEHNQEQLAEYYDSDNDSDADNIYPNNEDSD
jgi:hypothetical protein